MTTHGCDIETITIMVRDMPRELWQRLKAEAALRGLTLRAVLEDMIRKHLDQK